MIYHQELDPEFKRYTRSILDDIFGKSKVHASFGWKYIFFRELGQYPQTPEYRIKVSDAKREQMAGSLRRFLETEIAIAKVKG